ncbi:MAG: thioredoxin family protein [Kiritimatiellia bacterium]
MKKTNNRKTRLRNAAVTAVGFMAVGLLLFNAGCGRSESPPPDDSKTESSSSSVEAFEPAESVSMSPAAKPKTPALDVPEDAPVLSDVYPTLTSGALRLARLTELPDNVLLQAEGMSITEGDLKEELAQVPAETREEIRENAFFLLKQQATMELLTALAQRRTGDASLPQDRLLQRYFENITRSVSVTDADIATFYEENASLMGNASLEQMKPRIREHLRQQKQQETVEEHIAALGSEMTIALDGDWVREQAALAMDNPVDKARASGKPTFVNFGARGCRPCDMMIPIREEIRREYEGRLNVVFVHVNQDRMLASRYGVRGIPHLVFFDEEGKQVHTHTGFMPREQIEKWIKKIGVSDA